MRKVLHKVGLRGTWINRLARGVIVLMYSMKQHGGLLWNM